MHAAIPPPALPAELACGFAARFLDMHRQIRDGGFKMRFEQRKNAWHRSEDGDALALDGFDQARSYEAAFKMDFSAKDGRNPEAHGLPEDVAERQRVEKPQ